MAKWDRIETCDVLGCDIPVRHPGSCQVHIKEEEWTALRAERDTALATIEKLVGALEQASGPRAHQVLCPCAAVDCVGVREALALARCPECLSTPHKISCSRTEGRPSVTVTTEDP